MRLAASSVCAIAMSVAISLPAESQERVTAIKARQIIDGTGGPPIADGIVIVRGDRIESVGTAASIGVRIRRRRPPLGRTATLQAGVIDTHGHLSLRFGLPGLGLRAQQSQADRNPNVVHGSGRTERPPERGHAYARVRGESHWNDLHIKQAIERGVVPGPRMILGGARNQLNWRPRLARGLDRWYVESGQAGSGAFRRGGRVVQGAVDRPHRRNRRCSPWKS